MSERQLDLRLTYKIFNFLHENLRRKAFYFNLLCNNSKCFKDKVLVRALIRFSPLNLNCAFIHKVLTLPYTNKVIYLGLDYFKGNRSLSNGKIINFSTLLAHLLVCFDRNKCQTFSMTILI